LKNSGTKAIAVRLERLHKRGKRWSDVRCMKLEFGCRANLSDW
jgi:hypothetical protein